MCHGPTGGGTQMGPGLTNGLEYEVIKEKVTKGPINPGDTMPPLGAALSAAELDAVAKYVEGGF
jgi:mono/diheme cytochrome c family protein